MTPLEFLTTIWPPVGFYTLATPYTPPNSKTQVYAHKVVATIKEAADFAERQKHSANIFFCVHSLLERSVFDPTKTDPRTGELGAPAVRLQRNMCAAKAFFFDLDVGTSTQKVQKYDTQADAVVALKAFCRAVGLPKPMVVSSGGGIHVYWLIDTHLPSEVWRGHASKLRKLAAFHGMRLDPSRTTDTASVLRVAGTFNMKNGGKRPVEVLMEGVSTLTDDFVNILDKAVDIAGLKVQTPNVFAGVPDDLGSNLNKQDFGPPPSLRSLTEVCPQVVQMIEDRKVADEPEWYLSLNVVRHCEKGEKLVHKISEEHPDYSPEAVERKVAQLERKGIGAPTCTDIASKMGEAACEGCAFVGKVKSPFSVARYKDPAPQPVVSQLVGGVAVATTTIPDPPFPYIRLKGGKGVAIEITNKDNETENVIIYDNDLFPIQRLVNTHADVEQQLWRISLPRSGDRDFTLDADALYDRKKFVSAMANVGAYIRTGNIQEVQNYMIAYISKLQQHNDAAAQCNHLGWSEDYTQFILPDKILCPDGTAKPASLSLGAKRSSEHIEKRGTMADQIKALGFYNNPAYLPSQFSILASLAAPLFYMTRQHGVIINLSGQSGASKSTTLYAAASMWGNPELYAVNGTNKGMSALARDALVSTLANLPVCVDEITKMIPKDAVDLAMNITQPSGRRVLDRNRVEKASQGGYKSTIMISTANNSLHGLLATDNATGTAGSMRVFEIVVLKNHVYSKAQADDFWFELTQNYGHIGEVFMAYVTANKAAIEQRVREVIREIDLAARVDSSERFWSATIAAVIAAGEIANKLGLLPYDVVAIKNWALYKQIPYMRGVVTEEYDNPTGTLADYLETISGNTLISRRPEMTGFSGNLASTLVHPHGQLLAHYELADNTMYVLKKGFRDYCTKVGANALQILDELHQPVALSDGRMARVLTNKHCKKVLGASTEYAKAQSWCFVIDMTHPEVRGLVDLAVVGSTQQPTPLPSKVKSKASLKLVDK